MASSVIFIGSPQKSPKNLVGTVKQLFFVSPNDIIFRIVAAFVPPIGIKYRKIYVDFLGPLLAVLLLGAFVNYGYSLKIRKTFQYPTEAVFIYSALMPLLCWFLCKLGRSCVTLYETTSLIGYALYGHFATLLVSFLCYDESSNFFFFICLIVFGGLSTLRLVLVILKTIALPAARLLVCSLISIVNVLFLIFLHFAYMHRTFVQRTVSVFDG